MERKSFLKNGLNSVIGISALPVLAPNLLKRNQNNSFGASSNSESIHGQSNDTNSMFNVYNYGAVGDGKEMDTKAIQKAINACHKAGGGIL